jgi:hypothetical protein
VKRFLVGLDLGQASDFTALVVLDREKGTGPATYAARHIERVRGVPYPDIVSHVQALLRRAPLTDNARLVIDATGVGAAVVDLFRRSTLNAELIPVSIHGGDRIASDRDGFRVPKRDLAAAVAVLLQTGRLKIGDRLPHARTLADELRNFRVTINPATAHESFAAWREKDHDDLVLAAALAAWAGEYRGPYSGWFDLAEEVRLSAENVTGEPHVYYAPSDTDDEAGSRWGDAIE